MERDWALLRSLDGKYTKIRVKRQQMNLIFLAFRIPVFGDSDKKDKQMKTKWRKPGGRWFRQWK